jgi:tetratricopeptide (TPR) repeat protein
VFDSEGMNLRKDLLLTFGSMAAVGAVVFGIGFVALSFLVKPGSAEKHPPEAHAGEKKKDAHGKHEATKSSDKHAPEAHGAEDSHAKPPAHEDPHPSSDSAGPKNTERLTELENKYKSFVARGMHDDARTITAKAFTIAPKNDPEWLKRSGDATFNSSDLGSQQRYAKALATYTDLLNSTSPNLNDEYREWAQWRICECLHNLMHFDDALRAMKAYLGEYPRNPRRHEIRLKYANCLVSNGRAPEALTALDLITGDDVPKEIAARALNERARIILERSKNDVPDAPIQVKAPTEAPIVPKNHVLPGDESPKIEEIVNAIDARHGVESTTTSSHAPAPETHHAEVRAKHEVAAPSNTEAKPADGVSNAKWAEISAAVQEYEFAKAADLLKPYIDDSSVLTQQQRAQVMLRYAALLTEATQSGRK